MEYNGKKYTWVEFKQYWKAKTHGGWLYDDASQTKDAKKDLFEFAWQIAGKIYCQKYGLDYVDFNKADYQKQQSQTQNIHYIFALDDSGSMSGTPWNNLIKSFKETIEKIKSKDSGKDKTKISLILFN